MPELPEVTVVVSGLKQLVAGQRVEGLTVLSPGSWQVSGGDSKAFLVGAEIIGSRRLGKVVVIDLDSGYSLLVHLKMTGQLVYVPRKDPDSQIGFGHPSPSLIGELPDKTTRVIFELEGGRLFFNDGRKFGWVRLLPTGAIESSEPVVRLGPDALDITTAQLKERLASRQRGIKACLLDQAILAGCGNIYADESLWASRIDPQSPAGRLTDKQIDELRRNLQQILQLSIDSGGSSSRNYVNAKGERGDYLAKFVRVYGRAGQPCYRCQGPIERIVVAGRGTHWCPPCQRGCR